MEKSDYYAFSGCSAAARIGEMDNVIVIEDTDLSDCHQDEPCVTFLDVDIMDAGVVVQLRRV